MLWECAEPESGVKVIMDGAKVGSGWESDQFTPVRGLLLAKGNVKTCSSAKRRSNAPILPGCGFGGHVFFANSLRAADEPRQSDGGCVRVDRS